MSGSRARLRRQAAGPLDAPFLPITSVLRKIGTALVAHFGAPAAPGCPRARESHSARFAGVGATWPGHEAGNLPVLCVSHASDHLIGIAALLDADNVVMACLSLVRPTLESLAAAYYLLDPACDERERVRRWANMQLTSYVERLNIDSGDMAAARQLQQLLDAGRQHGWAPGRAKRPRAGLTASAWLDQPLPSGQALVGDLLDDLGPGAGALLHRASSGVLHGQVHGMHLLLRSYDAPPADDPRDVLIAAGLSVLDVVVWTAPLVWGIGRLLERANAYYGWSPGLLERDLLSAQRQWVAWLRQVGQITVDCDALMLPDRDQHLVLYTAPPGSRDAQALALLNVLGADNTNASASAERFGATRSATTADLRDRNLDRHSDARLGRLQGRRARRHTLARDHGREAGVKSSGRGAVAVEQAVRRPVRRA